MELDKINGGNVYLDSNIFIYAIEENVEYKDKIQALFSKIENTESKIITSELTLIECLVKPYSEDDYNSISVYEEFIKTSDFLSLKSLPLSLLKKSAQIRAKYNNKLPDSIHLATALKENCNVFITNDKKIKIPEGIGLIILSTI